MALVTLGRNLFVLHLNQKLERSVYRSFFLSISLVALLLPGLATQASAVTVQVGFIGNEGSVVTMTDQNPGLGCGAPGSLGEFSCTGENFNNGNWTLDSWDLDLDPDPLISNGFTVTNNSLVTQSFFVSVSLPTGISFGPPSLIRGSIQGGATDAGGAAGVTLSSAGAFPFYDATIDGVTARTLLDAPQSFSTPFATDSVSTGVVNFGIPVMELVGVPTNATIGLTIRFDLTAGDRATFTGVFEVLPVPEPGTALLMGLGLIGLAAKRRRA